MLKRMLVVLLATALCHARFCRERTLHRSLEIGDVRMLRQLGEASRGERLRRESQRGRSLVLDRIKRQAGIGEKLASCHTAKIDGYVVEGHVPAADIKRLIAERPDALGLTVPGMPVGSPGMEQGDETEPYDTLLDQEGRHGGDLRPALSADPRSAHHSLPSSLQSLPIVAHRLAGDFELGLERERRRRFRLPSVAGEEQRREPRWA